MSKSGKSVDPILIGIIAVGIVGAGVFYYLKDGQNPAALAEPAQPDLSIPSAKLMSGNANVWGNGTGDAGGGQMAGGPGAGVAPPVPGAPSTPGAATTATGAAQF